MGVLGVESVQWGIFKWKIHISGDVEIDCINF